MSRNIRKPAQTPARLSSKEEAIVAARDALIAQLQAELAEARMAIRVYKAQVARLKEAATPLEPKPVVQVSTEETSLFIGSQSLSQSFKKPARRVWGSCFKKTEPAEETITLVELPSLTVNEEKKEPTLNDDTDIEIPAPPSSDYWSSDESSNESANDDSPNESE